MMNKTQIFWFVQFRSDSVEQFKQIIGRYNKFNGYLLISGISPIVMTMQWFRVTH